MWNNIVPIVAIVALIIISVDRHHTKNNDDNNEELKNLKSRVAELEKEVRELKR